MAEYTYVAAKMDGKTVRGTISANSPEQLKESLRRKELYLIEFDEKTAAGGRRLKSNQLADFCRELSSMLGTGVSLVRSMQILIARELPPALKASFVALDSQIKRGIALSEAMELQSNVFPNLLISMVRAGEANGRLDKSLEKMADHYDKEHRTNQDIKGAMTYPIILIVITLLVIVAVFAFIFPTFSSLFDGMELPVITQIMMNISDLFTHKVYIVIIFVLAVVLGVYWITRLEKVRYGWDKLKIRIPKVGHLLKIIYTARFARTFASLYSGGLTIMSALQISKDTIGNRYIAGQFDGVIRSVRAGTSLSEALREVEGFDIKLIETIAVGEENGKVDELLERVADSFDYESAAAIKALVKMIEPIMIFIMACIILTVMLSVMLPIYQLYGNIEQSQY